MATPISPAKRTMLRTRAHQLAAEGLSHRAIGEELGVHHTTIGRLLRTDSAPSAPAGAPEHTERTTPERSTGAPEHTSSAPPALTCGISGAPGVDPYELHPRLFDDITVLIDCETGDLPAPLAQLLHQQADLVRARWRTTSTAPHHQRTSAPDPTHHQRATTAKDTATCSSD